LPHAPAPRAQGAFAYDLWAQLRDAQQSGAVSPPTVLSPLGRISSGARGVTRKELLYALALPDDNSAIDAALKADDALWERAKGKGATLLRAARVWVDPRLELRDEYKKRAGDAIAHGDFAQPEAVRGQINAWVSSQTQSKVSRLLPEQSLTKDDRMATASAMYFRGQWASSFPKTGTRDAPFFVVPGKSVPVPTMSRRGNLRAGAFAGGKLVELPYAQSDLAMLVIAPDAPLAEFEANLDAVHVAEWAKSLAPRDVALSLPKFAISSATAPQKALAALGVTEAFRDAADFGDLATQPTKISNIFHQTFVAVDEVGTEAAAATVVVTATITSLRDPEPVFEMKVDRPFVFLIVERERFVPLVIGHVVNPKPETR
jgi:serpin B